MRTPWHNGHPANDYAGEELHVNPWHTIDWNKLPSITAVDSRGINKIKGVDCIFRIWNSDSLVIVVISKGAPQGVFIKLTCLEHNFYYVDLCMWGNVYKLINGLNFRISEFGQCVKIMGWISFAISVLWGLENIIMTVSLT